jgi:putative membrane protein
MKTTNYLLAITVFVLAIGCGPKRHDAKEEAKDENEQKFNDSNIEDDSKFAVTAADGGMLEVKLGELAKTNGMSQEVKSLGKMMVEDHSKANEELKALASQKNVTLPIEMGDKCQRKYEDLAKKTGKDFDKAYTDLMVKDHKDDIDLFKKEADKGNDPEIKSWAAGKVAVLEHHLERSKDAKDMVDKMK